MAEQGFFWAQIRRKPLSELRDSSLPRDLINKGENIFKKGETQLLPKGEVDMTGALQTSVTRSLRGNVWELHVPFFSLSTQNFSASPSATCCCCFPLSARTAPLLFYLSSCLNANSAVTTVLLTGLQTERGTLTNPAGVSLAPCGLTLP